MLDLSIPHFRIRRKRVSTDAAELAFQFLILGY